MKTERIRDYVLTYDDSPEAKDQLFQAVVAWCKQHQAYSGESIMQRDDPQIYAPILISEMAEEIIKFNQKYDDDL